jgi:hypothetical protein
MSTQVVEAEVGTNANGATINQGFMMASTNCLKHIKKTGTKPNKTPSLEKPSLAVIACLKMETTCALYKAIDNFYLYKAYKIDKGRFSVFFVVHVTLAHR